MKIWITSLFLCIARSQDFNNHPCPHPCECSVYHGSDEPIVDVVCEIPSINGNDTDFSTMETNVTSVLHLYCDSILNSRLDNNIFQHLYSFKSIKMVTCQFDFIPEHALYGLSALQELHIQGARSLKIHDRAFMNTPNLRRLTITDSGMRIVPNLNGLHKLKFINFTNNHIENLSDSGMFDSDEVYEHLFVLILNNNRIRELNMVFHSTLSLIKYIAIADNLISSLSEQSFRLLTGLEFLDLSGNNLSVLPDNLLEDNFNLKVMGLGSNPISAIPDKFFTSTTELQVLSFVSTNVDESAWMQIQNLTSLHELQFGNCKITAINNHSLSKLKLLQYVDVSGNGITRILNDTFQNQRHLQKLILSNNSISVIEVNAFNGLQSLTNLDLTDNKLNYTYPETFSSTPELFILNMSYNALKEVPCLNNSHKLFMLDLRNNQISTLDNKSFIGLSSVGGIILDRNKIETLSRNVLQRVPSLQLLRLSHNNIKLIDRPAFKEMNDLKWVFLDHNKLQDISYVFRNMSSLIQLDLSYNNIGGVFHSGYFYKSFALQHIYLSNNNIESVEDKAFYNFPNLEMVDLTYNKLSSLTPRSLMFSPLAKPPPAFYLMGNRFICDCRLDWMRKCLDRWTDSCRGLQFEEFEFLICARGYKTKWFSLIKDANIENMMCNCNMEHFYCEFQCPQKCTCFLSFSRENGIVDCTNQNITDIQQIVSEVVKTFYLDGNKFSLLESNSFNGLSQLEILYLNRSGILTINTDSFDGLSKLKTLYLNDNSLREIGSRTFLGLSSLEFLNLEDNLINFVANDTFKNLLNLRTLRLASNRLTTIPYQLFASSRIFYHLSLADNPWSCDCDVLEPLTEVTYVLADVIEDRRDMYCYVNNSRNSSLETGTMLNLIDLDMPFLCPNQTIMYYNSTIQNFKEVLNQGHIQALVAVLILVLLLIIIVTVIFVNRKLLQVVLYNKLGVRLFHEKLDNNKLYDAFVSYSHKDEGFVVHELVPRLEHDEGYKLCVHFRDFPVGACIADTIIESVENSRRTIMVVSNNFLESEWCQYEFKTAHHSVLKEKSQKIILILMENIDQSKLDPELKLYMKSKTYLKRQDPWFWEKIFYAMPDVTNDEEHKLNNLNKVKVEDMDDIRPNDLDKVKIEVIDKVEIDANFQKNIL